MFDNTMSIVIGGTRSMFCYKLLATTGELLSIEKPTAGRTRLRLELGHNLKLVLAS